MNILSYVFPSILRNPRRSAAYLVGTVIAVALVSSVLFFVVASSHVMTQRTIAPVRIDFQAILNDPNASTTQLKAALAARHDVVKAERFAVAGFNSAQVQSGTVVGQTASGKIMAMDPSYFSAFGAPIIRQGHFGGRGFVISVDMGTNLGARVGDKLTLYFGPNIQPVTAPITGIANMQHTDVVFAPIDPILRLNPFNPPANVVMMDYAWFESTLKHALLAQSPSTGSGPVVRSNSPVLEQVQLRLARGPIPSDPAQAKIYVSQIRRAMEVSQAGRVTILDNISASIDQAQSDVLWAQAIFIFLAIPGIVLAAALARYVTATAIEGQRRELALLRIRGVGPRLLMGLLGTTLLLVAIVGVVLGIGAGWTTSRLVGAADNLIGAGDPLVLRSLLLSLVAGLILGVVSALWPLMGVVRSPIMDVRRRVGRTKAPLWERLYLDVICLIASLAVYEVIQQNGGFAPVLNAEGNPTVSLSIFAFVSPLLFWIGSILLLVRFSRFFVSRSGKVLARWSGKGVVRELAARTIERRSGSLNQAVLLVAMAVAFSSGLIIFVNTYNQQQRVDAELTLGSDVKVTMGNRAQSNLVVNRLNVPGVTAVTPFRTTLAYVGTEIQDIFGVDVHTFLPATKIADTFFLHNTAAGTMHRLQSTPNGIIVSQETFRDYSLKLGDSLRLRLFNDKKHAYVFAPFKVIGVAREFATAPKDAFLVTNYAYLNKITGQTGAEIFLIKASGPSQPVAAALRARFAAGPVVTVTDLSNVQQTISTSLTSLNLAALTKIDYSYTVIMLVTGLLVFTLAVLLDRRRDYAMMQVIGATTGQVRLLLLTEVGYAVIVGIVFGLLVGLGFAQMLIQILTAIFDPPPDALAIPWNSLGLIIGLAFLSAAVASALASRRLSHLNLSETLREM